MATIVVPLDGSEVAERALRPACSIAARLDAARLLLLHCAPDDPESARALLDDRARLFSRIVDVDVRIVDHDDPADAMVAAVDAEPDALLCLATRGRGSIGAAVLGSVAADVVCRATRPLVLVGPRCRTALLPAERGRMLIGSDGSDFSNTVVPIAGTWCARLGLEPWLCEVVGPDENPMPADGSVPNREVAAATRRLQALAAESPASLGVAEVEVLHGEPGRSIPWFAERLPAGLVAIATHGRSGLGRIAMGSVATDIVRHAPCPVLLTRPAVTDSSRV